MSKRTKSRKLTNAQQACVIEATRMILTEEFGSPLRMLHYTVRMRKSYDVPCNTWRYDIFGLVLTNTRGPLRVFDVETEITSGFRNPDDQPEHLSLVYAKGNTSHFNLQREVWMPARLRFYYSFDYADGGFFQPLALHSDLRGISGDACIRRELA